MDEFNNRSDTAEKRTNDPKDNKEENTYTEAQKDTRRRNTEVWKKAVVVRKEKRDQCLQTAGAQHLSHNVWLLCEGPLRVSWGTHQSNVSFRAVTGKVPQGTSPPACSSGRGRTWMDLCRVFLLFGVHTGTFTDDKKYILSLGWH